MSGARENLNPENRNGSKIGKNADRQVSDTQEHLGETLEQKKYKEQTINYWLNEVFWLDPRIQKRLLKAKVDFNKRVPIKDLLEETGIKDMGLNLTTEYIINIADASLNEKSMDAFLDYLEDDHIIKVSQKVSVEKFLELLSLFESERFQRICEWADECLMSDSIADFKKYCEELGYNWETKSISRKKFEELLKSKETHDLENDSLLS